MDFPTAGSQGALSKGTAEPSGLAAVVPLVTVVIPTLNRSDHLRKAVECVIAQDYPKLEILISDNGSTDDTSRVVQELLARDRRVRYRRNLSTVPMYAHFTQCVHEARGEYFVLLCDDDRINDCFVRELMDVAIRHPQVGVVLPANAMLAENGAMLEICPVPSADVLDGPQLVVHWLLGKRPRFFVNPTTLLFRTRMLREFGGYQAFAGERNNDNLLFLQCAICGPVGFAKEAVFSWRVHAESFGSRVTPREVAESGWQFLRHLDEDPSTRSAMSNLPVTHRIAIKEGIRHMTALEYVYHVNYLGRSVALEILCGRVPGYRWDRSFVSAVARHYWLEFRSKVLPVRP